MLPYFIAFFGILLIDTVYIMYIRAVNAEKIFIAAITGSSITAINALVVIEYTRNPSILIVAVLGGFSGTYLGYWISKYMNKP